MKRLRENIVMSLLASLYLATAAGLMITQITMPSVSSGPEAVGPATGSSQQESALVLQHRRHIPMAQEVTAALLTSAKLHLNQDLGKFILVGFDDRVPFVSALYFSSFSDKSPPLS
jgi:hypothetical protein